MLPEKYIFTKKLMRSRQRLQQSDAVAFLLYEIFEKFRTVLFKNRATALGGVEQLAKNQEAVRPFEPRRGSILVEESPDSSGNFYKKPDAAAL